MNTKAICSASRTRSARLLLLLLAGSLAVSCGPEDDGSGAMGGVLQIDISTPSGAATYATGSATGSIEVGGYVSESPYGKKAETACTCSGFGCLFGQGECVTYYYPRVDVVVQNLSTGQSVAAMLSNNSYAQSESGYSWHATIPLVSGSNSIVAHASDGSGHQGSDTIVIQNP